MSYPFPRSARILSKSEYSEVFKHGKMLKGQYWQILVKTTKTPLKPRLGLVISKKICKLAVDRNRFKRIARETFRLQQQNLKNWSFVVMIAKKQKTKIKRIKNAILSAELHSLLQKAGQN